MSVFVIVSRNHVLNSEKSKKLVDFVHDDSDLFFNISRYFATRACENANLKRERNSSFFSKIKRENHT